MFYNVYSADFYAPSLRKLLAFYITMTLGVFLISGIALKRSVSDNRLRGAMWQFTYRSNLAIIGLALAEVLVGETGLSIMAVIIAIMGPIYNILAVISLESCRAGKISAKKIVVEILNNPFVRAMLLALPFSIWHIKLPTIAMQSVEMLGKSGMILALITLGASLDISRLVQSWKKLVAYSFIRLIGIPGIIIIAAIALGFRDQDLSIILISSATPLAAASYTMARVYDSDYEFTGQMVVATSLLCCLTLFFWIFILKQTGVI